MSGSGIEYVDETWNPTTGCTPVSAGCARCWAAAMAKRFPLSHAGYVDGDAWKDGIPFSRVTLHPDRLDAPLRWRKPRVVGVCFMGDLFHEDVPLPFVVRVFGMMMSHSCADHTFLILTKRPERMRHFLSATSYARMVDRAGGVGRYYRNLYLGVSVEDQATADERIPILLDTPAAHRWVSVEPLLAPFWSRRTFYGIDWLVAGCESGPKRRPARHERFRFLRDQCQAAGVRYFLKQMSANEDGTGRVVKMPELDGRRWAERPW